MSALIIACANHKGGVGKSTTVANLGAVLASGGSQVLAIDLDPQGSLSISLGRNIDELDSTIYNVLADSDGIPLETVVTPTAVPGLHLAPANLDLAAAELELISEVGHERLLKEVIASLRHPYDYILIDCPPSLGLLTINALVAADHLLIPLQAEYLAMRGIKQLLKAVGKVRKRINPQLQLAVLVTMATSTVHAREIIEEIRTARGQEVLETVIKRSIKFADASVRGLPLVIASPHSEQARSYHRLAQEVQQWRRTPTVV